jgi:DNA-binding transcriptional ArsR family regulator
MSTVQRTPDYDLEDVRVVSSTAELKAMFDELRGTLLDLLLERAATVAELATAIGRPKGTVAYHVGLLVDAGLLTVVRTRKVRAIDERYYGRTARVFQVGSIAAQDLPLVTNNLALAATESIPAHAADDLRAFLRYARLSPAQVPLFWERVVQLVDEFAQLPRDGKTVYALSVGLFPTDRPRLPDLEQETT